MVLDFLRLYHKAVKKSRLMKEFVLKVIKDVLSKGSTVNLTNETQMSEFVDTLEQDFNGQINYPRVFLVGSLTMSMFWVIALFNLLFSEQAYEKAMVDFFSRPFRIVFANLYLQIQEYLASQLTTELFQDLSNDSLQEMADRKDK